MLHISSNLRFNYNSEKMNFYCLCLLVVFISIIDICNGFSIAPASVSRMSHSRMDLEMKRKGKRVPIQDRGEYMKRQRILYARSADEASRGVDDDTIPTFQVFARPRQGGLWIPAGDLKGDQRATAICNAIMTGFMTSMYEGQLTQGIARSLFAQGDSFAQSLIDNYKPFSKLAVADIQFGYKVKYEGFEEKMGEQKVIALEKGMERGWQDNVADAFKGVFGGDK